jgi:hypothetical protein
MSEPVQKKHCDPVVIISVDEIVENLPTIVVSVNQDQVHFRTTDGKRFAIKMPYFKK